MINDQTAKSAKPSDKRYLIADGRGLYLEVMPSGKKIWRYRGKNGDGKRTWLTLGEYPELTVKGARDMMPEIRRRASEGLPFIEEPKPDSKFGTIAEAWAQTRYDYPLEYSTKQKIRRALTVHILPAIGDRDIAEITPKDILDALQPLVDADKPRTARNTKTYISQIFRYAAARGLVLYDPCTALRGAIFVPEQRHHPRLRGSKETGDLLRKLNDVPQKRTRLAALFLIYTFCRTGEMRHAEWEEIDLDRKEWRLAPDKMKMRRPHIVPLSRQMISLLDAMRSISEGSRYIFPHEKDPGKPIGSATVISLIRRLGYSKDALDAHGFRGMASTTLNENGFKCDWIERQLAHIERNAVRAAYNYADYLQDRHSMMQWYSDHLDALRGEPINLE